MPEQADTAPRPGEPQATPLTDDELREIRERCESVANLSSPHLQAVIQTIGLLYRQEDRVFYLTAYANIRRLLATVAALRAELAATNARLAAVLSDDELREIRDRHDAMTAHPSLAVAPFTVNAHGDVPRLLAEVDRLRGVIAAGAVGGHEPVAHVRRGYHSHLLAIDEFDLIPPAGFALCGNCKERIPADRKECPFCHAKFAADAPATPSRATSGTATRAGGAVTT